MTLLVFPATWRHDDVRTLCGNNVGTQSSSSPAKYFDFKTLQAGLYSLGDCEVRWAFILAVIATCDGFILGEKSDF